MAGREEGHDERGYGYADYDAAEGFGGGYGLSLSSPARAARLACRAAGRRPVSISEAAWDGTQDVFAMQAAPSFRPDLTMPGARIAALEAFTSWRVTAPLPRLTKALKRP